MHNVTATQTTWKSSPYKFEAGTPPIAQAYGLAAGIDYLKDIGMEKIWEHTKELTFYALEQLNKITAIKIIGPEDNENRGPVISFTIDGIHPHDIAQVLSDNNICVRAGTHCTIPLMQELNLAGTTRISFFVYNTKEDVDKLVAGIKKVLKVFK